MESKNDHINIDQLGRDFPFNVPNGYFEELPAKVMARIEAESKPAKELFFFRFLKPSFGLVASFIIILCILYFPAKLILPAKINMGQPTSLIIDEEYYISYPLSDHTIYETLESSVPETALDNDQLETVLLANMSEYELIDLNNLK